MTAPARIAIIGGTFDPPHFGHLVPVEVAATEFDLDCVWYVPAFIPPHKQNQDRTDPFHRSAMLALALRPYPKFLFTAFELLQANISYTVQTLRWVREKLDPNDRLFFIMGSDSFLELSTWYAYDELLALCDLIIINRGARGSELKENLDSLKKQLGLDLDRSIHFSSSAHIPISSSAIREAIRNQKSISAFVPAEVEAYIRKHSLYQRRLLP